MKDFLFRFRVPYADRYRRLPSLISSFLFFRFLSMICFHLWFFSCWPSRRYETWKTRRAATLPTRIEIPARRSPDPWRYHHTNKILSAHHISLYSLWLPGLSFTNVVSRASCFCTILFAYFWSARMLTARLEVGRDVEFFFNYLLFGFGMRLRTAMILIRLLVELPC